MRHHHAQRGPGRGIQPEAGVEEPQRHHPGHARRHRLPHADPGEEHPARRAHLEEAHHHRPARLRRRLQELPRSGVPGPGKAELVFTADRGRGDLPEPHPRVQGAGRSSRASTTPTPPSPASPRPASPTPSTRRSTSGSAPRTPSPRPTTPASGTSSTRSTTANWKAKFEAAGIDYFFTLIDDAVARIMKSEGGILWACKNYDGDVMSDMVASRLRQPGHDDLRPRLAPRATSSTRRPTARCRSTTTSTCEGEKTSTNSMALIFAWTGALQQAGRAGRHAGGGRLRRRPGAGGPRDGGERGHDGRPAARRHARSEEPSSAAKPWPDT